MTDSIAIHGDVIQALGRIAWVSMNLEDWTKATCEMVLRQFDSRTPIGEHIKAAVERAHEWPRTPEVIAGIAWLEAAAEAMKQRNHVVHAVPAFSLGPPRRNGLVYIHKAKDGKREPSIETPLEVGPLTAIADGIEATLDGWRDAHMSLHSAQLKQ